MRRTKINDLEFCETERCSIDQVRGSVYRRNTWTWGSFFTADFDATDFSFSTGFTQLYGFALGATELSNENGSTGNTRWSSLRSSSKS